MSTATPSLDALDAAAHELASYRRATSPAPKTQRTVLERFPAGAPRGSWPAEEFAQGLRRNGRSVDVFMDLATDSYLVVEGAS